MNKTQLISKFAEKSGLSKNKAGENLNTIIEIITEELKNGEKVTLTGFGTFSTAERAPRTVRHPQTGEEITIPARRVPKFKAGKELKDGAAKTPVPEASVVKTQEYRVSKDEPQEMTCRIEGQILLEGGQPAGDLVLRLYSCSSDTDKVLLAETNSMEGGRYSLVYEPDSDELSLEVWALDNQSREILLSKLLHGLSREPLEVLDLIAPW